MKIIIVVVIKLFLYEIIGFIQLNYFSFCYCYILFSSSDLAGNYPIYY